MKTPKEVAAAFEALDVHDDTVESFHVVPALNRRTTTKVKIDLFRHWEGTRRQLVLTGCANISLAVDATVLEDNAPNNTAYLEASSDVDAMVDLVNEQKAMWNVEYDASVDPLCNKLAALNSLVLFKIHLFGGNLLVLAKQFRVRSLPNSSVKNESKRT